VRAALQEAKASGEVRIFLELEEQVPLKPSAVQEAVQELQVLAEQPALQEVLALVRLLVQQVAAEVLALAHLQDMQVPEDPREALAELLAVQALAHLQDMLVLQQEEPAAVQVLHQVEQEELVLQEALYLQEEQAVKQAQLVRLAKQEVLAAAEVLALADPREALQGLLVVQALAHLQDMQVQEEPQEMFVTEYRMQNSMENCFI
jgi:hypothetical protein